MKTGMFRTWVAGACISFALITLTASAGARSAANEAGSAMKDEVTVVNDAANPVPVAQVPVARFQDLISANSPENGNEACGTVPNLAGKVKIVQKIVIDAEALETLDGPNVYLLTTGEGNFLRTELPMVKRTDPLASSILDKWGGQVEGPLLAFESSEESRFVSICARNDAAVRAFVVGVIEDMPTP